MMREKSSYSFLKSLVKGEDHNLFKDLYRWRSCSSVGVSYFCHVRKKNTSCIIPVHLTKVKKKCCPPASNIGKIGLGTR
jgi:hypothetical protein